jgi:signal transduction histidine kinase
VARRDAFAGRVRRILAVVSAAAFVVTLVVSGPSHLFQIAAALSMTALLGYTFAEEQQLRATARAVERVARYLDVGDDPRVALDSVLRELMSLFGARTLLFIARPDGQTRLYRRSIPGVAADSSADLDLTAAEESTYAFAPPGDVWSAVAAAPPGATWDVRTIAHGEPTHRATIAPPAAFVAAHPLRSLLAVSSGGVHWSHRLLLLDAPTGSAALRTLQGIARQLGPALCNLEALGRVSSRIGAAERARVARDIHDGIVQALIGLEMQVHVWLRHADAASDTAAKLEHIQAALRAQVLELRDLMHQIKPASCDPARLIEHLAAVVDRFQRDTGITAHFVSAVDDLMLSPRVCDEIVRIVEEALVNVRKHSGARHVVVRVGSSESAWRIDVDDDGRGFEFAGRRSQADLDAERKGPVIIKERIRSIGGSLDVESVPGRGARLEISFPRRVHG